VERPEVPSKGETTSMLLEHHVVQSFFTACCELHPQAWCRIGELWEAYEQWSALQQQAIPVSRRVFAAHVKARGCRVDRTSKARIWRGIKVVDAHV
jgi:hypothetical protein